MSSDNDGDYEYYVCWRCGIRIRKRPEEKDDRKKETEEAWNPGHA